VRGSSSMRGLFLQSQRIRAGTRSMLESMFAEVDALVGQTVAVGIARSRDVGIHSTLAVCDDRARSRCWPRWTALRYTGVQLARRTIVTFWRVAHRDAGDFPPLCRQRECGEDEPPSSSRRHPGDGRQFAHERVAAASSARRQPERPSRRSALSRSILRRTSGASSSASSSA
jgi:hypothetical protein